MTWPLIKLFLSGTLGKAWGWLTASSVHLLIATLGASLVWGYVGHHEAAKWKRVSTSMKAAYVMAQADAMRLAIADKLAREAQSRARAEKADVSHTAALDRAQSATDRFISAGGVRRSSCPPSILPATPGDRRAPVPAIATTDPIVVSVTGSDVHICAADHRYALDAYNWVQTLNQR